MSTLDLCQKYFGTRDIYKLLAISRNACTETIRKAYRRLSLLVHPDRVPEQEKQLATEKFKVLSKMYQVLIDRQQRSLYDLRWIVVDEADEKDKEDGKDEEKKDEAAEKNSKLNAPWMDMWEKMNKPPTFDGIKDDERTYVGSKLERSDIKQAYLRGKGCIDFLMVSVPYLKVKDEPRLQRIVRQMIAEGEVPPYKKFLKEPPSKRARRHSWPDFASCSKNEFELPEMGDDNGSGVGKPLQSEQKFNKLLDEMLKAETNAFYISPSELSSELPSELSSPRKRSKRVVKGAPKATGKKNRKVCRR